MSHDSGGLPDRGSLSDHPVSTLLARLGGAAYSGQLTLTVGALEGSVGFVDGRVVDARAFGDLGRPALFRLMLAPTGIFRLERRPPGSVPPLALGEVDELLAAFAERRAALSRHAAKVGGLEQVWSLRYAVLRRVLQDLPDQINPILRRLDGKRTVAQVIVECPLDEVLGLRVLAKLLATGVLVVPEELLDEEVDLLRPTSPEGFDAQVTAGGGIVEVIGSDVAVRAQWFDEAEVHKVARGLTEREQVLQGAFSGAALDEASRAGGAPKVAPTGVDAPRVEDDRALVDEPLRTIDDEHASGGAALEEALEETTAAQEASEAPAVDEGPGEEPVIERSLEEAVIERPVVEPDDQPAVNEAVIERADAAPGVEETTAEEPRVDEPTADAPAANEPAADASGTHELKTGAPAAKDARDEEPAAEAGAATEPAAEEGAAEEGAAEEGAAEEGAATEAAAEEPAVDEPETLPPVAAPRPLPTPKAAPGLPSGSPDVAVTTWSSAGSPPSLPDEEGWEPPSEDERRALDAWLGEEDAFFNAPVGAATGRRLQAPAAEAKPPARRPSPAGASPALRWVIAAALLVGGASAGLLLGRGCGPAEAPPPTAEAP